MDQTQHLQQQLIQAKARGYDLYQQCEQQHLQIQQLSSVLGQVAHKLGVVDLNSISPEDLLTYLDEKITHLSKPV